MRDNNKFFKLFCIASVLIIISSNAHAAVKCKKTLVSHGAWTNYLAAKSSARVHWRKAARRLHGRKYASWFSAKKRRYKCKTKGYLRRCKAIGKPCK